MGARGVAAFGNRRRNDQNEWHGRASLSLNNSALDASPYSLAGRGTEKPEYSRIRYGLSLGGALKIPKLVESSNTFLFLNYMGTRSKNPVSRFGIVPTAQELAGDFSASSVRGNSVSVYDPLSGLPFPGNQIPASRIDPAASGLAGYFPAPTLSGSLQNYRIVAANASNNDDFSVRLNHILNSANRLNGSFSLQSRNSEDVQLFGYRDPSSGRGLRADVGWSRTLAPNLVSNLRLDFSRNRSSLTPYFANGQDVAGTLGIEGTSRNPLSFGPPGLSFTNFASLSDGNPSVRADQSMSVSEGLTWTRNGHNVSFGFQYRRNLTNQFSEPNGRGSYTFSGLLTSAFDAAGNPVAGTGFDLADFLLGFPQTSSIRYGNADTYFRGSSWSVFTQDDWRVRPNLTVNAGLRYEFSQPIREKYGRSANLDVGPGFSGVSAVVAGGAGPYTGTFTPALIDPDRNNLAPRIGVAWKPFAKSSFLIRAGYGVYYNGSIYGQLAGLLAQQPPFAVTTTQTTSLAAPITIRQGFATQPAAATVLNTYAVDRGYRTGYGQTWNVSFQTSLPWALMLETGYLGTKGTRLDVQGLPNQAPPGSPADSENRRPIPYALGFIFDSSVGNSIYHAGQVRLNRRFRGGFSFNAQYLFGKSIDDVSTYGGGRAVVAQDYFNLRAERGLSSFDVRHTFNLNLMFGSPFGQRSTRPVEGWLGHLLRDWTLAGGLTARSGTPLTAMVQGNRSDAGGTGVVGSARADSTGLPVTSGGGWFNLAAFAVPPAGRYGNAARNTIPGPGMFSVNASVGRSFPYFGERRNLEFRAEAQNLLNSVNITGLGTTVNAADYGAATDAGSMRSISLVVSFRF